MALKIKNRKKVEKLVYDTMMKLEPGGMNAKKYKDLFAKMSDAQFLAFFNKIKNDETSHFYVENDLYGKNQVTMDSIEATAKFLGVPLEEYLYLRHKTEGDEPIRLPMKVPVMYVHLKRMQQILSKKNITNVDIDTGSVRSRITGGLNSTSSSGRFTDSDTQALISATSETKAIVKNSKGEDIEVYPIMTELMHMRGDNSFMRTNLQQQIAFSGEANLARAAEALEDTTFDTSRGQATHTLDVYYLGAGLQTDLVSSTYLTKSGSRNK